MKSVSEILGVSPEALKAARKGAGLGYKRSNPIVAARLGIEVAVLEAAQRQVAEAREAAERARLATAKSLLRYSEDGQVVAVFADGSRQVVGGMDRARFEAFAVSVFGEARIRNDFLGQSARPN